MGNIKLKPAISRPMIDILVKTERSRIMLDTLLYGIFPKITPQKTTITPCT